MERARALAYGKTGLAVVVWGASFIATKVALREVSPPTVVWLRFGIGTLLLGGVVLGRSELALPARREWGKLALLGLIGITVHQLLQSNGLVTARATTTAWIVATTPIFIAALGWLLLRERLSGVALLGITLAAGGVLVVVTGGELRSLAAGRIGTPGDLLVMVSAPNWALFSVLSRRTLQDGGGRGAAGTLFWVMGIGWALSSIPLLAGPGFGEIGALTAAGWLGIGFLGLFCSGLAYIFWYDALGALPASQVGAFLYLEPLVTVVVAAVVLPQAEPITAASVLGGGVILLGVWLVSRPGRPGSPSAFPVRDSRR
ncbi:MAG TPA: DMT family transporter [Chromatiales bacterium]|nr:DMT family transporter [Chromatiales bacterium]